MSRFDRDQRFYPNRYWDNNYRFMAIKTSKNVENYISLQDISYFFRNAGNIRRWPRKFVIDCAFSEIGIRFDHYKLSFGECRAKRTSSRDFVIMVQAQLLCKFIQHVIVETDLRLSTFEEFRTGQTSRIDEFQFEINAEQVLICSILIWVSTNFQSKLCSQE